MKPDTSLKALLQAMQRSQTAARPARQKRSSPPLANAPRARTSSNDGTRNTSSGGRAAG